MIGKRKFLIIFAAFIFSFGMLSVGFGFWTDQLNLEGNANVKLSIKVTDDIINVEYTTMDAIQTDTSIINDSSGSGESVNNLSEKTVSPSQTSGNSAGSVDTNTVLKSADDTSASNDTTNPADTTVSTESGSKSDSSSGAQNGGQDANVNSGAQNDDHDSSGATSQNDSSGSESTSSDSSGSTKPSDSGNSGNQTSTDSSGESASIQQ